MRRAERWYLGCGAVMGTVRSPCAPPHGSAPSALSPCTQLAKHHETPNSAAPTSVTPTSTAPAPFSQQQTEFRRFKECRQSLPSPRLVLLKLSPLWGPETHRGSACPEQEVVAAPSLRAGPVPGCAVPQALPPPGPTSQLGSEPRVAVETGQTAPRGHPNLGRVAAKRAPPPPLLQGLGAACVRSCSAKRRWEGAIRGPDHLKSGRV